MATSPMLRMTAEAGFAQVGYFCYDDMGNGFVDCPEVRSYFGENATVSKFLSQQLVPGARCAFNTGVVGDMQPMVVSARVVPDSFELAVGPLLSRTLEGYVPLKGESGKGKGKIFSGKGNSFGERGDRERDRDRGLGGSSGSGGGYGSGWTGACSGSSAGRGDSGQAPVPTRPSAGTDSALSLCRASDELTPTGERYLGVVKSFDTEKNFGFVRCEETWLRFHRDVFLHGKRMAGCPPVGAAVSFQLAVDPLEQPSAIDIAIETPESLQQFNLALASAGFGHLAMTMPVGSLGSTTGAVAGALALPVVAGS